MSTATTSPPLEYSRIGGTLADLLSQLGDIPASRVRRFPYPGTADEADFLHANETLGILCELVDGTLVEKPIGSYESLLAAYLIGFLLDFVRPRKLGIVLGADSMFKLFGGNIRMPDVAFVPKNRFPDGLPKGPVWSIAPSLAVDVLSASNTVAEIDRNRGEFFASGVLLMWVIDPVSRTVTVYRPDGVPAISDQTQVLDGGEVLPGLSISLAELFGVMDL
jgi:Uma2 family endonuclease